MDRVDLKKNSSTLDEMTRGWTARVKATRLANEFATRSVLEAVTTDQDESAKGYVRRGQSLAVRDDQKVMAAPGTNAGRG